MHAPYSLLTTAPSRSSAFGIAPVYANADFQKAFARSYLDFIISTDPNVKISSTITPNWPTWPSKEMYFGKTDAGEPDIKLVNRDVGQLARCVYVLLLVNKAMLMPMF